MSLGLTGTGEVSEVSFMPAEGSEPVLGSKAETLWSNKRVDEENPSLSSHLGSEGHQCDTVSGSSCKRILVCGLLAHSL